MPFFSQEKFDNNLFTLLNFHLTKFRSMNIGGSAGGFGLLFISEYASIIFIRFIFCLICLPRVDIRRSPQSTPYRIDCCSVANNFRTKNQPWVLFHFKQPKSCHCYSSLSINYYTVDNLGTTPYGVCVDDINLEYCELRRSRGEHLLMYRQQSMIQTEYRVDDYFNVNSIFKRDYS